MRSLSQANEVVESILNLLEAGNSKSTMAFGPEVESAIWHYTTAATFLKILETQELHLPCYRFMNDPSEGRVAGKMLTACWGEALDSLVSHSRLDVNYLRSRVYKYSTSGNPIGDEQVFVFSGTLEGDLLSHWARYGDDGSGVALKFRLGTDFGRQNSEGEDEGTFGPFVSPIRYWNAQGEWSGPSLGHPAFGSGIPPLCTIVEQLQKFVKGSDDPQQIENVAVMLAYRLAPWIKDSAYAEEKEVRIAAWTSKQSPKHYAIRETKYGLAPYMTVPLGQTGLVLESVRLGPKHPSNGEAKEAMLWVIEKHIDDTVEVSASNFGYR